ncbi:MAG: ribbon-helix-helix protein, CopG family [Alphaproteobacteria bacterium]|nr:ribbon-helix-helix protein, CopG family [Alphaproteobacteria bacterium]
MASPVSLRIDPDLKSKLEDIAKAEDRSLSYIAQQALKAYLDARDYRSEQILSAHAAAKVEKEFVSGEAMMAWVESWDTPQELPAPKPDVFRR